MQATTNDTDPTLAIPTGLSAAGKKAARVILKRLAENAWEGRVETGGCRLFYSPAEWRERGEAYGTDRQCLLVVVYDGGDAYHHLSYNSEAASCRDKTADALEAAGFFAESCTGWYSAIYAA